MGISAEPTQCKGSSRHSFDELLKQALFVLFLLRLIVQVQAIFTVRLTQSSVQVSGGF